MSILTNLQRRLDQAALEQARAEVVRLAEIIEQLEWQLHNAQMDAECWYEHSQHLIEHLPENLSTGITQAGELVIVGVSA